MHGTEGATATRQAAYGSAVRSAVLPLVLVVSLFFLWGVANNLNDILIRQFKKAFELTDFESGLVQSAFYLGYFLFAIPAGLIMRRYGYKAGIVVGLALYAAGAFLFYPAADLRTYGFFLFALFVIASGLSFLETSANPFVTVLGPPEGAERRLNFAQAFNPLGSIAGVAIGRFFIFSGTDRTPAEIAGMSPAARAAYDTAQSGAVQAPYVAIGVVVLALALLILATRFPAAHAHEPREPKARERARWRELRGHGRFFFAVAAQFFYVGAQVGVWSYLIRYAEGTVPGTADRRAADFLIVSLVLFMLGRFAGAALMRRLAPALLLAVFAAVNMLLTAVAVASPGRIGLDALIASSFFMSVMYPTIFALGVSGLGEVRKLASSVLVMAIVGGAVLTPAMGALSGLAGINWSMVVPLVCFAVVLGFALSVRRDMRAAGESGMKRFVFALDLVDDPKAIAEYEAWHRAGRIWPAVVASLRDSGLHALEIYRTGNRLCLIMEGPDDFSLAAKAAADAANAEVQAWERLMWTFQRALPGSAPGEKWAPMQRIFSLADV